MLSHITIKSLKNFLLISVLSVVLVFSSASFAATKKTDESTTRSQKSEVSTQKPKSSRPRKQATRKPKSQSSSSTKRNSERPKVEKRSTKQREKASTDSQSRSSTSQRDRAITQKSNRNSDRNYDQNNLVRERDLSSLLFDRRNEREQYNRSEPSIQIRVSLDAAVSNVRRSSNGRVIKAYTRTSNGRPVHYVRVLSENNRVRTYRVDAVTGRML